MNQLLGYTVLGEENSKNTGLPAVMHATLNCIKKGSMACEDQMRTCFSTSL